MYSLTLQNAAGDSIITSGDIIGRVNFAVPAESDGYSATYISSFINSEAEGPFSSGSNPAGLVFGVSSADPYPATGVLKISSDGHFLPLMSGVYDIGASNLKFRNCYIENGNFDNLNISGVSVSFSGHMHMSSDIIDFSEAVDDRVNNLLIEGTGVQLSYNDSGNALIINNLHTEINELSLEPQGFVNRLDSVISFNDSTRTFTIQPTGSSYDVYIEGVKFTKTAPETVVIGSGTALNYLHFDVTTKQLHNKTTAFNFDTDVPIAYIHWNANINQSTFFGEERHGIRMDSSTHKWIHNTFGMQYINGLSIGNYVLEGNGTSNSHAQMSISDGTLYQEDIVINIADGDNGIEFTQQLYPTGYFPVYYHSGVTGQWVRDSSTPYPVKYNATRALYNLYSGATWSVINVPNNRYFAMWLVATNDINDPILSIMGQREDSSLGSAENHNNWTDIDLTNIPANELRPLYRLIFVTNGTFTNTPKSSLQSILDLRRSVLTTTYGVPQNDHGNLFGLGDDDHAQYVHINEARTISANHTFTNGLTINNGLLSATSGNFTSLSVNNTGVSLSGHTHLNTDITNWNEAVDDRVNNLLVGTSGINISYDDNANTLTIAHTGVSGGGTVISNYGDNRLLTSDGTTTGINAESNISFDGSLLNVTGSGNFASGLVINNQTASTIASFDSNKNVTSLSTATYPSLTELTYVKGVTSAIQTQIDGKSSSTHVHGNITNAGAIGSTANLPLITTTGGAITVGLFGTGVNTFCQGNDSRLSDSRAPTGAAGGDLTGTYPNPTLTNTTVVAGTYRSVTVDAKGRITGGTNPTTISGYGITDVGNGTLTLNVSGTGLSGSASFTANQSGNTTFTVTSNATSANTGSTIVARDASGNFSAGTITATLSGNCSGTAGGETLGTVTGRGTTTASIVQSNASVRAPIFYDSNNTGYYLDPDSTSNLNRVNAIGWDTTGRNYSREWIEFTNYSGLYSALNGAHFYPNNASYGPWRIAGTRNGWAGLEFDSTGAGQISLMMNSGHTGVHNNTYSWQWYWTAGTFYVSKSTYGGGTIATVLDSSNYNSYALPLSGGTISGDLTVTGSVYTSTSNGTGGGVRIGDDGDIVDLNDGFCSMRFSNGVRIFSANKSGSAVITLGSNGTVTATTFSGSLSGNITGTAGSETLATVTARGTTTDNIVQSNASVRAPIFYDSNNTAYFLDPNGSSRLNNIVIDAETCYGWIDFPNVTGLRSAGINAAHFHPNDGSYGAWRVKGRRNNWGGLEFDSTGAGNISLMMNSDRTGVHNNTYGWQWYWENGDFYISKSTFGGSATLVKVLTSATDGNSKGSVKAFCSFNGQAPSPTNMPRLIDHNISLVGRVTTGEFQIFFLNRPPSTNYVINAMGTRNANIKNVSFAKFQNYALIEFRNESGVLMNPIWCDVTFFW
jgi:hypothetical protein